MFHVDIGSNFKVNLAIYILYQGVGVENGLVVCVGVPGTVHVVGHDVDKIDIRDKAGHVVSRINGTLASRHCGRQDVAVCVQGVEQLPHQDHEVYLKEEGRGSME